MHTNLLIKFYDFFLGICLICCQRHIKKPILFVTVPVILIWLLLPFELPIPAVFSNNIISTAIFLTLMQLEDFFAATVKPDGLLAKLCSLSYEIFLVHHFIIYHFDDLYEGRELLLWQVLLIFPIELVLILLAAWLLKKAESAVYSLPGRLRA